MVILYIRLRNSGHERLVLDHFFQLLNEDVLTRRQIKETKVLGILEDLLFGLGDIGHLCHFRRLSLEIGSPR
jgi:hypothetical protein